MKTAEPGQEGPRNPETVEDAIQAHLKMAEGFHREGKPECVLLININISLIQLRGEINQLTKMLSRPKGIIQ